MVQKAKTYLVLSFQSNSGLIIVVLEHLSAVPF